MRKTGPTVIKIVLWAVAIVAAALLATAGYGNARWNARTTQLLNQLDAAQVKAAPRFFNAKELDGLPLPVKRYFQAALIDGQPIVTAATVQHSGTFNMGEAVDNWKPFTSTQRVITQRPGFDWDARIKLFAGVAAHVHDAYIASTGLLKVAVFGLIPLADIAPSADLSKGELMRFVAEAAWYPTALLPSQGVVWSGIDAQSALATFTDAGSTINLRFDFAGNGLIDTVRAESRGRLVGGITSYAPWHGRLWNYVERGGMQIPLESEIAWVLPSGRKPYYRSMMTAVSYEFAPPQPNGNIAAHIESQNNAKDSAKDNASNPQRTAP